MSRIFLFLVLVCSTVNAQDLAVSVLEVTTETTTREVVETVVKDEDGVAIGDPESDYSDAGTTVESKERLVAVDTSAPIVDIEAEAKDWSTVEVELVAEQSNRVIPRRLYRLLGRGKIKVTVETRGATVGDWGRKRLIVDNAGPTSATVAPNFRVMITYETASVPRYVSSIIGSPIVRGYLQDHCVKSNGNPDFRFVDRDSHFSTCTFRFWCESLARAKAKGPQLIISNDATTYEGDLPQTVTEVMDLLRKYGG